MIKKRTVRIKIRDLTKRALRALGLLSLLLLLFRTLWRYLLLLLLLLLLLEIMLLLLLLKWICSSLIRTVGVIRWCLGINVDLLNTV